MNTIYTFAQSAIEEARSAGRYGTANLYSGAINSFRNFTGDIPLTFKEVTAGMIKKYEESLLQKGRRHNTISTYMRMLRSIFNQAYQQAFPIRYLPTNCSASYSPATSLPPSGPSPPPLYAASRN